MASSLAEVVASPFLTFPKIAVECFAWLGFLAQGRLKQMGASPVKSCKDGCYTETQNE